MGRRHFIIVSLGILVTTLSGCMTNALVDYASSRNIVKYEESVNQIYISENGKKLVFIGPKHHYIFDAPEVLTSPLLKRLHVAHFWDFEVNAQGQARGGVVLYITEPTPEEMQEAIALGFQKAGTPPFSLHDENFGYLLDIKLNGIRYSTDGFKMPTSTVQLKATYKVTVREDTGGNQAARLLTPLTVVGDVLLLPAEAAQMLLILSKM